MLTALLKSLAVAAAAAAAWESAITAYRVTLSEALSAGGEK